MVIPYDQTSLALECAIPPLKPKSSGAIHLVDPKLSIESGSKRSPYAAALTLRDMPKSQIKGSVEGLIRIFA